LCVEFPVEGFRFHGGETVVPKDSAIAKAIEAAQAKQGPAGALVQVSFEVEMDKSGMILGLSINPPEETRTNVVPEILLNNGRYYHFLTPDPDAVDVETIAHALSHIGRFTGHTKRFYSVAEHCVRASYIGPANEALERLMHDAGEALTGDVATPLKMQLGGYEPIESRAEELMAKKFGYQFPYPPSVKTADRIMLATEKRDLLPQETREWKMLALVKPDAKRIPGWALAGFSPYWKYRFLKRYRELQWRPGG
jgi:hypothetical protein